MIPGFTDFLKHLENQATNIELPDEPKVYKGTILELDKDHCGGLVIDEGCNQYCFTDTSFTSYDHYKDAQEGDEVEFTVYGDEMFTVDKLRVV